MNKFKYYFVLLLAGLAIVSCNKSDDDDSVVVPVRDYAEQYKADNDSIEKFLKTNYIVVDKTTFDVKIQKIPAGGNQVSIWDQQEYPLKVRPVYSRDVNYKVYYLTLNKGVGDAPCNFDEVTVSYTGTLLNGTQFDTSYGLARDFNLNIYASDGVIEGWGEIMPQFKVGTRNPTGDDGTITYNDYGAGVMFLPSGLGYYANSKTDIPAYSPLVFSFKLFALKRSDLEYSASAQAIVGDGVPTYLEDVNGDGYVYNQGDTVRYPKLPDELIDDTDKDGIPDFLDLDDDGDGYTTRFELTKPTDAPFSGLSKYYPYDPVLDNPATPNVDESELWGIPRRPTGELTDPAKPESITNPRKFVPEDYTTPGRLRIHLDKTYPYQKN
ncbi:FKBP-type peptidyl-prolyl cis-trans isomerase FkpA precursor [Flavobacterium anhuiense]|uniref:peptidylprolyl isomerase n=1 Tax=Flavobacterium anhuiense TaxID=459526 RepID=A0AAC9D0J8_9FLAO|nr:FKBP-type peptidyl-prolyl cis-trans isomerase [Flavobacterium anhuiense]AOC95564.1 FKBP-type peptidyl-prolyl cis-trans isomerase FkpA precursor [Flavobacterium anhuiense]